MTTYQEQHLFDPANWKQDAACVGYPTRWWYPELGNGLRETQKARAVCADCPVQEECLTAGLERHEDGIWGGYNVKERKALRRERHVLKNLVCQRCRNIFQKPANRQVVALYCSDNCRKRTKSARVIELRRTAS